MFTNKLILAFASTVLGSLALSSATVAADGETKTLTNNYFQEYVVVSCDLAAISCTVTFPPTTYQTTVVKAVSCETSVTIGSVVGMALGTSAGGASFYMPGSALVSFPTVLNVSVNASTYLFFNKGDSPYVNAFVGNGNYTGELSCTITGEHS
jgi:hypothetical protein